VGLCLQADYWKSLAQQLLIMVPPMLEERCQASSVSGAITAYKLWKLSASGHDFLANHPEGSPLLMTLPASMKQQSLVRQSSSHNSRMEISVSKAAAKEHPMVRSDSSCKRRRDKAAAGGWDLRDEEEELLLRLRKVREAVASAEGSALAWVCDENTLYQLTVLRPSCINNLRQVEGVSQTFVEKYGEHFVSSIVAFCDQPYLKIRLDGFHATTPNMCEPGADSSRLLPSFLARKISMNMTSVGTSVVNDKDSAYLHDTAPTADPAITKKQRTSLSHMVQHTSTSKADETKDCVAYDLTLEDDDDIPAAVAKDNDTEILLSGTDFDEINYIEPYNIDVRQVTHVNVQEPAHACVKPTSEHREHTAAICSKTWATQTAIVSKRKQEQYQTHSTKVHNAGACSHDSCAESMASVSKASSRSVYAVECSPKAPLLVCTSDNHHGTHTEARISTVNGEQSFICVDNDTIIVADDAIQDNLGGVCKTSSLLGFGTDGTARSAAASMQHNSNVTFQSHQLARMHCHSAPVPLHQVNQKVPGAQTLLSAHTSAPKSVSSDHASHLYVENDKTDMCEEESVEDTCEVDFDGLEGFGMFAAIVDKKLVRKASQAVQQSLDGPQLLRRISGYGDCGVDEEELVKLVHVHTACEKAQLRSVLHELMAEGHIYKDANSRFVAY
jgi:hypothetical protein